MAPLTRRQVLAMLGAGGGLLAMGYALRGIIGAPGLNPLSNGVAHADGPRIRRCDQHGHEHVYGDVQPP